ncbi:MAG: TonB family protein [Litoreibacter sp.]
MIASSRMIKVMAIFTAAGVHLGISGGLVSDEDIKVESAAGAAQAQIGTSFADMSAGTLTPSETEDVNTPVEPEAAENVQPTQETTQPRPDTAENVRPTQETAQPQPETITTQAEIPPTDSPAPEVVAPEDPIALAVLTPQVTEPLKPKPLKALEPLQALQAKPVEPTEAKPIKPVREIIKAAEDDPTASSPRPKRRDPELAAKAKPPTPVKPKAPAPTKVVRKERKAAPAKQAPKATREANTASAIRGSVTGTETAKATRQGTAKGRAKESGNANSSNYKGLVYRRISRIRRPNVRARGVAVVSFGVSDNGGLTRISIASTSGSTALDNAAIGVVKKAAPFPAPPSGAQRSFSIRIKGKG